MALGKPVIVTGYSGNLEFTSPENSYLVDWHPTRIGPHQGPYPPEGSWADPDLDHAAHLMRSVFDDPDAARARGLIARDEIRRRWTVDALAPALAAECTRPAPALPARPPPGAASSCAAGAPSKTPSFAAPTSTTGSRRHPGRRVGATDPPRVPRRGARRPRSATPQPGPGRRLRRDARLAQLLDLTRPRSLLSRYFVQYWRDHDELRRLFPGIESAPSDAGAFVAWLRESWYEVSDVPYQLAPRPAPAPVPTLERVWTTAQQRARRLLSLR